MKLGVLFSGGKDSMYATYLARKEGNSIECLINIVSENKFSYMFHTPSVSQVEKQASVMNLPLIIAGTKGEEGKELVDLEEVILSAKKKYKIDGVVTGALASDYQASRILKICSKLGLKCINPLWKKNQIELLEELPKNKFKVIIVGVAAFPLNEKWLGREIDYEFIREVAELQEKYGINPAGEGGEFESFVLNCPLFKHSLKVVGKKIYGEGNTWQMEIKVN